MAALTLGDENETEEWVGESMGKGGSANLSLHGVSPALSHPRTRFSLTSPNQPQPSFHEMTRALEQAFAQAAKLPADQQEALAALILEELASDHRWSESFAKSQDTLRSLAADALAEFRAGLS